MQVELRDGSFDMAKLQSITNAIVENAKSQSAIQLVLASFRANVPQLAVEVDRVKTQTLGVTLDQVFSALSGYLGSSYVDQFNKFGRVFQIYVQGDSQFRLRPEDLQNLTVRNKDGNMVPLGTLVKITPTIGPSLISLFNLYPSATIIGLPAQGFSSGEVLTLMEEIARRTLPPGTGFEWSAMSYQEKLVGIWCWPANTRAGTRRSRSRWRCRCRSSGRCWRSRRWRTAGSTTISTSRSGSCC
jgi:HAE1 family hydrophobic/amphiphilic exporter-1